MKDYYIMDYLQLIALIVDGDELARHHVNKRLEREISPNISEHVKKILSAL